MTKKKRKAAGKAAGMAAEAAGKAAGNAVGKAGEAGVTAPYRSTLREVLAEAGVMIGTAALVYFIGADTKLMSIAIAVILPLRFIFLYRRGDLLVFFLGVVVGGGNDILSMYKGVYSYAPPTILPVPIPVWMVIFWGEAFVFFRKVMRYGPFLGDDARPARVVDAALGLDIVIAVVYRMIIYRTASQAWLPDALFAAILIVRLLVVPPLRHERLLMLTILALGPLYEMALIGGGLYVYQTSFLLGMPLWLIVYWVFIFRALKAIIDRMEHYIPPARAV